MKHTQLVTSAILGILAGVSCASPNPPPATAPTASLPNAEKNGCGNHAPGACAAKDDSPADTAAAANAGPLAIARTETVQPGGHVEVNLTFTSAAPARATFKASGPLGWNVHSHPHGEMAIHEKGSGAAGEVTFQPPAPGTYSFLWTNDGTTPVTLDVKLAADRGVHERTR